MEFKALLDIASPFIAFGSLALAGWTLHHTKGVEKRLTKDERLVFGPVKHPWLPNNAHARSVLVCKVVNVGRRRATIDKIQVHNRLGEPVVVTWASEIDAFGNPLDPLELVAVDSSINIYIRRDDGIVHTEESRITVYHSQSRKPEVLQFKTII